MSDEQSGPGRPRDPDLDSAILAAAREHLAANGYDAMSVVAIAAAAGTTRQAVYRRWPSKADLATAAIASLPEATARPPTDDPFADLVAELAAFRRGVTRPNGVSMVGSMLQEATDPELRKLYRKRLVEPRRARLRAILERAVGDRAACPPTATSTPQSPPAPASSTPSTSPVAASSSLGPRTPPRSCGAPSTAEPASLSAGGSRQ